MFGISLGEMLVVALVALVIVGPQRLPAVARYCGSMLGKLQRQTASIKRELSQEMDMEELRQAKQDAEKMATDIKYAFGEPMSAKPGAGKIDEPDETKS